MKMIENVGNSATENATFKIFPEEGAIDFLAVQFFAYKLSCSSLVYLIWTFD